MKLALVIDPGDTGHGRLGAMVRRMAQAQTLLAGQETRVFEGPGIALACTTAGERATRCPALRVDTGGNVLAFAGYPVHLHQETNALLDRLCRDGAPAAWEHLPSLDGAHVLVLWDRARSRATIASDHAGMQPLYQSRSGATRIFASEVKAVAAAGPGTPQPDAEGWAAFVGLGHMALDLTMLEGATAFPPACLLEMDTTTGAERWQETWRWPAATGDPDPEKADTSHLLGLIRLEVERYEQTYLCGGTHLLSGGWDSRVVLAARTLVNPDLHTVAVRYRFDARHEADSELAAACAQAVGARHRCIVPSPAFYGSKSFEHFLAMTDVATPGLDLLVPTIMSAVRPSLGAVWEGVAAGSANFGNPPGVNSLDQFLATQVIPVDSKAWKAVEAVFTKNFAGNMRDGYTTLRRRLRDVYGDAPEELLRFRVTSRNRFRTAKVPFAVYQNEVATFCPPMSRAYWTASRSLPAAAVFNKQVLRVLLDRHFPALARIPVLSGGDWWPAEPPTRRLSLPQRLARETAARLRSMTGRDGWHKERLIDAALGAVDPDDPRVNADLIRRLREDPQRAGDGAGQMRRLLFYWHHWSRVMGSGRSSGGKG